MFYKIKFLLGQQVSQLKNGNLIEKLEGNIRMKYTLYVEGRTMTSNNGATS